MIWLACVFWACVSSVCQMGVFYSGWKTLASLVATKKKRSSFPDQLLIVTQQYEQNVTPLFQTCPVETPTPNSKMNGNRIFCCSSIVQPRANWKKRKVWQAFTVTVISVFRLLLGERTKIYKMRYFICVQSIFSSLSWCVVLCEWLHLMVFKMIYDEVVSWIDVMLCLHSSLRPAKSHPTLREQIKSAHFQMLWLYFMFVCLLHPMCRLRRGPIMWTFCCIAFKQRSNHMDLVKTSILWLQLHNYILEVIFQSSIIYQISLMKSNHSVLLLRQLQYLWYIYILLLFIYTYIFMYAYIYIHIHTYN